MVRIGRGFPARPISVVPRGVALSPYPGFRGSDRVIGASQTSILISMATMGAVSGDYSLVGITIEDPAKVITIPLGWTEVTSVTQTGSTPDYILRIYERQIGASEPNATWSWTGAVWASAVAICLKPPADDLNAGLNWDVSASTAAAASGDEPSFPTVDPTHTTSLLVGFFGNFDGAITWAAGASGMTLRQTSNNATGGESAVFTEEWAPDTATGSRTIDGTGNVWPTGIGLIVTSNFSRAKPTFVNEVETVWDTDAAKTSPSFSVVNDDIIVAIGMREGWNTGNPQWTISDSQTPDLTWTKQQEVVVDAYTMVVLWTAIANFTGSMTVTITGTQPGAWQGLTVYVFRDSDGVGNSAKTNVLSGAPTLNITPTKSNSALVVANDDYLAGDGASRAWRANAGALTERVYFHDAVHHTVYSGYHEDAGVVAAYAVGLSAPDPQKYSIITVEIKGKKSTTVATRRSRPLLGVGR